MPYGIHTTNLLLQEIDKVILVPSRTLTTDFKAFAKKKGVNHIPISQISKKYNQHKRFQIFENLCETVQEKMTKMGIQERGKIMPFLVKQQKYNQEYEKFLADQEGIGEDRAKNNEYETIMPAQQCHVVHKVNMVEKCIKKEKN